jgi:hypothetical protein
MKGNRVDLSHVVTPHTLYKRKLSQNYKRQLSLKTLSLKPFGIRCSVVGLSSLRVLGIVGALGDAFQ